MIYTISSDLNDPPCPEAKKITIPFVERMVFSSPEEYDEFWIKELLENAGSNYRILADNCIAKDVDMIEKWAVEFETIEEFEQFLRDLHKNVVITTEYDNPDYFHIAICEEV